MSVQSEITRLENAKAAIKAAIEGKGVTVPDATLLDGMAALIESIEAGAGAEVSSGSFTLSNDVKIYDTDGYSIVHGLSNPPDLFILLRDNESRISGVLSFYIYYRNMTILTAIYGGTQTTGYSALFYGTPIITTETVAIISQNSNLTSLTRSHNYKWVAVGGLT